MFTKLIIPIIEGDGEDRRTVGTQIDYRLFGLLICRKIMFTPSKYGLKEWEFTYRI
ncbi:MAG: hypothetical protein IJC16_00040 [Rikenellaceae bacterium]|nr:hypothetical protein [Rikenellaceae bacterium]